MKTLANLLINFSERVAVAQVMVAQCVIAFLCPLIAYGVVMRYLFRQGISWAWELAALLFLVINALTLAYVQLRLRHIHVDMLLVRLSKRRQSILKVFDYLVFFIFCFILLCAALLRLTSDWVNRAELTQIPMPVVTIILCVGLLALMLQLLVAAGKELAEFSRKPKPDGN